MECEWCGHTHNLTDIGNLVLCESCLALKEEEDAFDEYFESHSLDAGNVKVFFESRGHTVFEKPINFLEYIGAM